MRTYPVATTGSNLISQCQVCASPCSAWCDRCKDAFYCSKEHLDMDWPRHKHECRRWGSRDHDPNAANYVPQTASTLSSKHNPAIRVTALLFAANEGRERVIDVTCIPSPDTHTAPIPILDEYFPEGIPESLNIHKGMNDQDLRFPLCVWFSPTALTLHSPTNRSIQKLLGGVGKRPWCGTVVVLKYNGSRLQGWADAGNPEIPTLAKYFMEFY
ncbi:hypothetical protein CYLTODRAFT_402645 [Cylindrobasidium torrendii FP15055 ss-10]|uniref:MYND-type domain-containing protein n=1 Tax=Cylindrobasidium torrendii FP15055 ss-10 TaxID=1314674 RepID=A0A0D7B0T9_9AGAR|nr:hypothetical protein CYLTODRAFT_402645 [Cylindrobasidium torrendii FP15055 ss-10]